jgi:hypothetical protein
MSSSTLFFDPDLRVRREDHSDGLISWLAAINPANIGLQQGFRSGSEQPRCASIASVSVPDRKNLEIIPAPNLSCYIVAHSDQDQLQLDRKDD